MKTFKVPMFLIITFGIFLSLQSCKDEFDDVICQNNGICVDGVCNCPDGFSGEFCEIQDFCFGVVCQNGGACVDGICECPEGYIGINCESFDPAKVQHLLDKGFLPKVLINGGVPQDSLYGKMYEGGLIFHWDANDYTGLIAATKDGETFIEWINAESYCEVLVLNNKEDWFFPSKGELNLMWKNLADSDGDGINVGLNDPNNFGDFENNWYWSSSLFDFDIAYGQFFGNGEQGMDYIDGSTYIRPARAF